MSRRRPSSFNLIPTLPDACWTVSPFFGNLQLWDLNRPKVNQKIPLGLYRYQHPACEKVCSVVPEVVIVTKSDKVKNSSELASVDDWLYGNVSSGKNCPMDQWVWSPVAVVSWVWMRELLVSERVEQLNAASPCHEPLTQWRVQTAGESRTAPVELHATVAMSPSRLSSAPPKRSAGSAHPTAALCN